MIVTNHHERFSEVYNDDNNQKIQVRTFDDDLAYVLWTDVIISEMLKGRNVLALNAIATTTERARERVAGCMQVKHKRSHIEGGSGSVTFMTTEELERFPHWVNTGDTLVYWSDDYQLFPGKFPQRRMIIFCSTEILCTFTVCNLLDKAVPIPPYVPIDQNNFGY
jgi:hypothetical protein